MTSAATGATFEGPPLAEVGGIGALTLGGFLAEIVERHGPSEAIVLDDALCAGATQRWSYDRLGAQAQRYARSLVGLGVGPGDTVAIVMGNRPDAIAALFATAMIGAVSAPVSTFSALPEIEALLDLCSARVVLTQRELLGRRFDHDVAEVAGRLESLGHSFALGTDSWGDFLAAGSSVPGEEVDRRSAAVTPEDPALVIFSSGTTAAPKAMLHTNRAPALQFWLQSQIFARSADTRMFSALPIFWTAGLNTAVGSTLAAGGCWVAQEAFDAGDALALMEREKVTEPYTLPHQTAAIAEHPDWAGTDLSSIRCAYGKGAYARHPTVTPDPGWIMPVGYGMSETCAFIAGHRSDESREQMKVGNGKLLAGTRLRVIDPDTGRVLGTGDAGELAVAGETLMIGYLGRDAAGCFDADGFFHTGDAGHVDAEGIVHYTGRYKEMIRTGGANVSPTEIEVVLRSFAPVKLSRVLGMPDERLEEIVVACVVTKDDMTASEADVKAFLRERVAPYKVPKQVLFIDEEDMPMTAGDTKVRDEDLRALVTELLRTDQADPAVAGRHQESA